MSGDEGDRTPDLLNAIQALSQLSYIPMLERYGRGPPIVKSSADHGWKSFRLAVIPWRQFRLPISPVTDCLS